MNPKWLNDDSPSQPAPVRANDTTDNVEGPLRAPQDASGPDLIMHEAQVLGMRLIPAFLHAKGSSSCPRPKAQLHLDFNALQSRPWY